MGKENTSSFLNKLSRREFVKASSITAGGLLLGSLPLGASAYASGSDMLKIALLGCGSRGTGAAANALSSNEGIQLVAMADILEDQLADSYRILSTRYANSDKVNVPEEHKFIGFNGSKGFLSTGGPEGPTIRDRKQNELFRYEGENDPSPYDQEHVELIDAIRSGNTINNVDYASKSTMTAVMGFMATYSGKFLEWDEALNSDKRMYPHHDLLPEDVNWDTPAPVQLNDDGFYPIPVPGVTEVL